jgi:ATP-dependent Clp protease protease subunit
MTILPFNATKYPPHRYGITAKGNAGEIMLYGVIGDPYDGISAAQFMTDLRKLDGASVINIHINSPGGIVSEGRAIFNRLKSHSARKIVHVDSEASSIAALIAMAGDEIRMLEGSVMLVHRAWGVAIGNANQLRDRIRDLETIDQAQVETFTRRTGMKPDAVLSLMDEDRYMSAEEAVRLKFADVSFTGMKAAALSVDRSALGLPELPAAKPTLTRSEARARMEAVMTTQKIKPARGAR